MFVLKLSSIQNVLNTAFKKKREKTEQKVTSHKHKISDKILRSLYFHPDIIYLG